MGFSTSTEQVLVMLSGIGDFDYCSWITSDMYGPVFYTKMDTLAVSAVVEGTNPVSTEQLLLFGYRGAFSVAYAFIEYYSYNNGYMVYSSIVALAWYDSFNSIFLKCICDNETRGGKLRKQCTYLYAHMIVSSTSQLIGTIQQFVTFWYSHEF